MSLKSHRYWAKIALVSPQADSFSKFNELLTGFESQLSQILKTLESLKATLDLDSLSVQSEFQFSKLSLGDSTLPKALQAKGSVDKLGEIALDDLQERIVKDMEKSYGISFKQLTDITTKKMNYLGFSKTWSFAEDVKCAGKIYLWNFNKNCWEWLAYELCRTIGWKPFNLESRRYGFEDQICERVEKSILSAPDVFTHFRRDNKTKGTRVWMWLESGEMKNPFYVTREGVIVLDGDSSFVCVRNEKKILFTLWSNFQTKLIPTPQNCFHSYHRKLSIIGFPSLKVTNRQMNYLEGNVMIYKREIKKD